MMRVYEYFGRARQGVRARMSRIFRTCSSCILIESRNWFKLEFEAREVRFMGLLEIELEFSSSLVNRHKNLIETKIKTKKIQ